MAWSTYSDISQAYPNLSKSTSQASSNILSKLRGQLSPETQAAIQDASARFGITSGMPGSGLVMNRTARDLGRATEDLQSQGLQEFLASLQGYSGTIAPTVGQRLQDQQFRQDLGFRQGEANRAYGLAQNRQDLAAAEFNQRFGPELYERTFTPLISRNLSPGGLGTEYSFWRDKAGRTSKSPTSLMFKYKY